MYDIVQVQIQRVLVVIVQARGAALPTIEPVRSPAFPASLSPSIMPSTAFQRPSPSLHCSPLAFRRDNGEYQSGCIPNAEML